MERLTAKERKTMVREGIVKGLVDYEPRHQVDELLTENGAVVGVKGSVLEPSDAQRGEKSSRTTIGTLGGCLFSGRIVGQSLARL